VKVLSCLGLGEMGEMGWAGLVQWNKNDDEREDWLLALGECPSLILSYTLSARGCDGRDLGRPLISETYTTPGAATLARR